jgi:hypothetical protein
MTQKQHDHGSDVSQRAAEITDANSPPELSVILVTLDEVSRLERTLNALRKQTTRDRLELLIVAPDAARARLDPADLSVFHSHKLVEVGSIETTGQAIAAGVRLASAPVTAYAEEHSYPTPEWAATLITRHRENWAAVGWTLLNANPKSSISWAHLFTDFAPWVWPAAAGETQALAWHHTSYKRDLLVAYEEALEAMLDTEGMLHADLVATGHQLFLEPEARSFHLNVSAPGAHLLSEFLGGRGYAAARARCGEWGLLKRLLYIFGGPLIPVVRLWRSIGEIRRKDLGSQVLPRILPALSVGLMASAAGEVSGYAFGGGKSARIRLSIEQERHRHLSRRDRDRYDAHETG